MLEVLEKCQRGILVKYTERTAVHFLSCTHELREICELVQAAPMAGKDKSVKHRVVLLVDWSSEPFTVARHLDDFVWRLWIEYVPAIDELRDTVQIS